MAGFSSQAPELPTLRKRVQHETVFPDPWPLLFAGVLVINLIGLLDVLEFHQGEDWHLSYCTMYK